MIDRTWVWESVDDVLAAVGFLLVLSPVLIVTTTYVDVPAVVQWVALILLSAAAGAAYRERGSDIGNLGSFILAASIAIIPVALLVNGLTLLTGLEIPLENEYAIAVGGAYLVAYWYAYGGGRERVRGPPRRKRNASTNEK